jgi:hypothetical protein
MAAMMSGELCAMARPAPQKHTLPARGLIVDQLIGV